MKLTLNAFTVGLLFSSTALAGGGNYSYGAGAGCVAFFALVLLAIGYWVLTLSAAQEKPLNTLGRIIGGLILISALGGLIMAAVFAVQCSTLGSCHHQDHPKAMKSDAAN